MCTRGRYVLLLFSFYKKHLWCVVELLDLVIVLAWWWSGHGSFLVKPAWFLVNSGPGVDTIIKKSTHPPTRNFLEASELLEWAGMSWYSVNYDPMVTRYTGPMVTRCFGGLSQLPEVQMSFGKKYKKKLSNLNWTLWILLGNLVKT